MQADIDAIIGHMEWAAKHGLSDMSVSFGGTTLRLRRGSAFEETAQAAPPDLAKSDDLPRVNAPMAGICHLCPDETSPPFVAVGDMIEVGQTLCIIEAMKVMTSVTSTCAGTVTAILVQNGDTVSAETPLFEVQP